MMACRPFLKRCEGVSGWSITGARTACTGNPLLAGAIAAVKCRRPFRVTYQPLRVSQYQGLAYFAMCRPVQCLQELPVSWRSATEPKPYHEPLGQSVKLP